MKFRLENVIPVPLKDTPLSEHSLWKKDIEVDCNAITVAEAPSGTGKTTLLSIMYGVRHDYEGKVYLDGTDIRSFDVEKWGEIRRDNLAVVFQDLRLFSHLTAMQNIMIKNQLNPTITESQVREIAEHLGVAHRLDAECGKLSLGQQQRVAIIRALAQPFSFLLLDEPFSHLDETNSKKVVDLVMQYCEKNNAGLLMTSLGPSTLFPFNNKISI